MVLPVERFILTGSVPLENNRRYENKLAKLNG
jgi:hypothetical protein